MGLDSDLSSETAFPRTMATPTRMPSDADATVTIRYCPKCKTPNPLDSLAKQDYRCSKCGFEMAYLDVTTTGVVRGILGWIRREGEVIEKRYRVSELLGRGGFGSTYLVDDLQLDGKRRAIKEIPRNMFNEAESSLLARLEHPAIPDIIDRLDTENMVYLVLKFGGARTLGSERKRMGGRIPIATLTPWMVQLCRVLDYLHSQNPPIIHRDLKPDNVLLDEQDNVMLIDFGIAKLAKPNEETRTLGRAVSVGFSSPEQFMGTGTDARSDIYSLGATIYFLLTGSRPPALDARLGGKKLDPISRRAADVPAVLDQLVTKTLEMNPDNRPQSVAELLAVFGGLERRLPRKSAGKSSGGGLKILIIVFALLLGAAVLAAGVMALKRFIPILMPSIPLVPVPILEPVTTPIVPPVLEPYRLRLTPAPLVPPPKPSVPKQEPPKKSQKSPDKPISTHRRSTREISPPKRKIYPEKQYSRPSSPPTPQRKPPKSTGSWGGAFRRGETVRTTPP